MKGYVLSGNWPITLNALFIGIAHYLFIISILMVFHKVFVGKLSILRVIYGAQIFRPLSRISFSVALVQGLVLFLIVYS